MYLLENRFTLEHRPLLEEYLQGYDYKTSGTSFSSLFMWQEINQFSWQIIGDYLCITGNSHLAEDEEPFLFPPLTKTGTYDPLSLAYTILEAKKLFDAKGFHFSIMLLPFHMLDIIKSAMPGLMEYVADRPNFDYVYRTQDLIDLKGREYHPKKNHLNYFKSHYEYEYVTLTSAMKEEAMQFIREFNLRKNLPPHEMELLRMEERAMEIAFENLERVGYMAGAIRINGKIEALSIGGVLNRNTVTVHVEKANIEYRGLYQAINNEFCKHVASTVKYINREEDMGIPGLRKAKLSYNPCKLIEKYVATLKQLP